MLSIRPVPSHLSQVRAIPEVHSCTTREEICRQCDDVHAAIVEMIREMPDDLLNSPGYPEGWTAAKNINHIARSTRYFSFWVGAPAWFVSILGKAREQKQKIEDIRATNRPRNFDYGSYQTRGKPQPELKARLEKKLLASADRLKAAVNQRSEEEMDSLKGLFGGMNMRNFVLFTIKHAAHHSSVVHVRLKETAAAGI